MKESKLNKSLVDFINKDTIGYAYKRVVGPNNVGHPDVTGCIEGIRIEMEGKSPGKKPTPIQKKRLKDWELAGAITGVFYSLKEAIDIIDRGLKLKGIYHQWMKKKLNSLEN